MDESLRQRNRIVRQEESGGTGSYRQERKRRHRKKRLRRGRKKDIGSIILLTGVFCLALGTIFGWFLRGRFIRKPVTPVSVEMPDWIEQDLLTINPYSRPGTRLSQINGIVIHYVGNPGTSAEQNRNYFEGLKSQTGENKVSVSSNFVIGMDGEILLCVPIDEMAYASNSRNIDTISIECCHPETDGAFTEETYESLVRLTAWLCSQLDLKVRDVIRHYDVTKKACPKYFVDHPDEWERFLKDVKKAMKNPGSPVDLT